MSQPFGQLASAGVAGALARYRVMAWIVGTMLIILCVIAIPLQYAWNRPALANVVAPVHGVLYIIYLVTVAALARRAKFTVGQVIALVCAGFVPGLAFYIEHKTTKAFLARQREGDPGSEASEPPRTTVPPLS